jgi:outer membrane protein assembly factor BamC
MHESCNMKWALLSVLVPLTLAGCGGSGSIVPDRRPDYKATTTRDSLEVPPDLTSSTIDDSLVVPELGPAGTATYSDYARERGGSGNRVNQADGELLVQPKGVRVARDGTQRWLVVDAPTDEVWNGLKRFWTDNGFALERQDPVTGVLETQWAENRADIPDGSLRRMLGDAVGFLYSAPTRDKFRTRVEQGLQPGTTEVFLTHYGAREVQRGEYEVVWEQRPRDPSLEAEMLRRMMISIGISDERAMSLLAAQSPEGQSRASLLQGSDGRPYLRVERDYGTSWRLIGIALDENGFPVEEGDSTLGIYKVRYRDALQGQRSGGVWSKLAFWRGEEPDRDLYQVQVTGTEPSVTTVAVLDAEGAPVEGEAPEAILELLNTQLR